MNYSKNRSLILLFLVGCIQLNAQQPAGGGEYQIPQTECISKAERIEIFDMLDANSKALQAAGTLVLQKNVLTLFAWPLKLKTGITDPSYYGISNYVDEMQSTSSLQDYNCGTRTYNNHKGTDIFLWPFAWTKMANNEVEIIAAAPGTIIGKTNGNSDQSCATNSNTWNAVYVQHADGSVAFYGHMKNNSLTSKAVGQTVVQGEFLGVVGSSGNSTGPHLHFEVYTSTNYTTANLIDPWAGTCNTLGGTSWWAAQKPYFEPTLNRLATHTAPPSLPQCPPETPNLSNQFNPGSTIYFVAYYHDQNVNQNATFRIKKPDGSVYATFNNSATQYYSASYWYWSYTIPSNQPQGNWSFEGVYQGQSVVHHFNIGSVATMSVSPLSINVPSAAGSSNITVTSNTTWTVSDNANWVTLSAANGSNNGTITATFTSNGSASTSRTCEIKFTGAGTTQTVILTQGSTDGTICVRPTGTNTTNITGNSANINWSNSNGVTTNTYRYRVAGTTTWINGTVTNATTKLLTGLTVNTGYQWQVRSKCGTKYSDYTAAKTFTTAANALVVLPDNFGENLVFENENLKDQVAIYPNPANDLLHIDIENDAQNEALEVMIYDLSGKLILRQNSPLITGENSLEIEIDGLNNGIYTLKLRNKTISLVQKFVKE